MNDVIDALKIATANGNGHAWAKAHDFHYSFVYRVLTGTAPPSKRMCEALGFRKAVVTQTTYEKQS